MNDKTDAMCNMILAFMIGRGGVAQHGEIGEMVRMIVPHEARRFGFYIWHLYNRDAIERVQRGIYRLTNAPDRLKP
jgi:hypothetical protein